MGPLPASAIGLHLTIIDLDQMAAELLRSTFHRFTKVGVQSGYSGAQDAQAVMERAGCGVCGSSAIKASSATTSTPSLRLPWRPMRPAMPFKTRWANCPWCGAGGAGEHGDSVHPAGGRWCEAGAGCRRPHLRGGRGGILAAADRSCAASTQVRTLCLDTHSDGVDILLFIRTPQIRSGSM